jgi:hypothetical protein
MIVTLNHKGVVSPFLQDLQEALATVRQQPSASAGKCHAFLYGGTAQPDSRIDLKELALSQLDDLYSL